MDVQITDVEALRRISSAMLSAYLESHGWVRRETWRERIVVWSKEENGQASEILAPLREQSDTYGARISEIMGVLAETQSRSQLDVYFDLLGAGSDVIRMRPLNGSGRSEWTLPERVEFLTKARDLLTAAARTAERPGQAVYRGRASSEVIDYVRTVRPLPGYESGPELTLHSQVPAGYGAQMDLGDPVRAPFPRRAAIALNEGLREASRLADRVLAGDKLLDVVQEATAQGANANIYDAVAALARGNHGINVNLTWAVVRPSTAPESNFAFSESAADVFQEGAELLRQTNPFIDANVTGEIVRLDRESNEEFHGRSVVLCELDERPIALHVQFLEQDRENVLRAFESGLEITVNGDIIRSGRTYTLQSPRNFAVIDTDSKNISA